MGIYRIAMGRGAYRGKRYPIGSGGTYRVCAMPMGGGAAYRVGGSSIGSGGAYRFWETFVGLGGAYRGRGSPIGFVVLIGSVRCLWRCEQCL